jgi:hypothetical protein
MDYGLYILEIDTMRSAMITIWLFVLAFCSCSRPSLEHPSGPIPLLEGLKTNTPLPEPLQTLNGELTIANKTSELPGWCKTAFVTLTKESRFEMAEPGEKFQVTDVIREHGLPSRRLAVAGFSRDRCFIHYEKGGFAHSYFLVLFAISRDGKSNFLWGGTGFHADSDLGQLRSDIANGKFRTHGETQRGW